MYKRILFISVFLVILISGCSSAPMTTKDKLFDKYLSYDYCKLDASRQSIDNSCGVACLSSVLNYWNIESSEDYLLRKYAKESGYSILELSKISEDEGLRSYSLSMYESPKKQLDEQLSKGRPVICATMLPYALNSLDGIPLFGSTYRNLTWMLGHRRNHYVVVFGWNYKNYLVMDPSFGIISLDKKKFYKCWKDGGYCVLLCGKK